jgi:hypothetical protein
MGGGGSNENEKWKMHPEDQDARETVAPFAAAVSSTPVVLGGRLRLRSADPPDFVFIFHFHLSFL